MPDRLSEQAIAAAVRQLTMADVSALLRGEDRDARPAVLEAATSERLPARAPVAGSNPPNPDRRSRRVTCCYCHRRIYRQRNGEWYHYGNGSVSCRPGEGSDRRATP